MLETIPETPTAAASKMPLALGQAAGGSGGLSQAYKTGQPPIPAAQSAALEWLTTALRKERQQVQQLLLTQHEVILQYIRDGAGDSPLLDAPMKSKPLFASASKQELEEAVDAAVPSEGVRVQLPVTIHRGAVANPWLSEGSNDPETMRSMKKATSSRGGSKETKDFDPTSSKSSKGRSLVYGDRHPDQGLFHIDFSSMRTFVKGPFFETSFAILILINTIFMALEFQFEGLKVGYEMEGLEADIWPWARRTFQVAEWFFGLVFTCELIMKLAGLRWSFFRDFWNYLDVFIVAFWILDVLPLDPMLLRIMRLAKLLRLIKLAKSIKSFDSLYLLTASIASSASALVWSGILICIVQLLVALVLSTFLLPYCLDERNPLEDRVEVYRYFGTFSKSMLSMFELTLGNWVPISRILSERVSEWYTIFTLAFQVVLGFAVIKVITGVFLTETMKVASMDDSIMLKSKERAVRLHKEKMRRLFMHADLDGDGGIDVVEFQELLNDKEVRQWLASMELEIWSDRDGYDLFQMIDDGDGQVSLDELVKGVARLKGQARNVDLALLGQRLGELRQEVFTMQQTIMLTHSIQPELEQLKCGFELLLQRFQSAPAPSSYAV